MAYDKGELRYRTNNSAVQNPSAGVCAAWTTMWLDRLLSDPSSLNWTEETLPSEQFNATLASQAQSLYEDLRVISNEDAHELMVSSVNGQMKLSQTRHNDFLTLPQPDEELYLDLWETFEEFLEILARSSGPFYCSFNVFQKMGEYAQDESCAHAIGFHKDTASGKFYVFDPNKGLIEYETIIGFRDDFLKLFTDGGLYDDYLNGIMTFRTVALQ